MWQYDSVVEKHVWQYCAANVAESKEKCVSNMWHTGTTVWQLLNADYYMVRKSW